MHTPLLVKHFATFFTWRRTYSLLNHQRSESSFRISYLAHKTYSIDCFTLQCGSCNATEAMSGLSICILPHFLLCLKPVNYHMESNSLCWFGACDFVKCIFLRDFTAFRNLSFNMRKVPDKAYLAMRIFVS